MTAASKACLLHSIPSVTVVDASVVYAAEAGLVEEVSAAAVSAAVDLEEDFDEKVLRSLRFKIIRF